MVSFKKYKEPMSKPLDLPIQEQWREKFAADVVKLAQESEGRDDFLKCLHDETAAIGHNFVKVGSGTSRAVFALPLGLVAKLQVIGLTGVGLSNRLPLSPNAAELERSQAFPAFVPKVYAECYSTFGRDDQVIDMLVSERMIPLGDFTDHITGALGSTNSANLGICPRSGRVMVLDVGGAWTEGVEESFLRGDHYLQAYPFMKVPRW